MLLEEPMVVVFPKDTPLPNVMTKSGHSRTRRIAQLLVDESMKLAQPLAQRFFSGEGLNVRKGSMLLKNSTLRWDGRLSAGLRARENEDRAQRGSACLARQRLLGEWRTQVPVEGGS
jgi:hypothetical protein